MQKQEFSIDIKASCERVWSVLWEDTTFRDWASFIDEGTYMVGELKEGSEVQFISSVGGYGVTSLVTKLSPHTFVSFHQIMDTKDSGESERDKEWTGGEESYSLTENDGVTTLKVVMDVPPSQEETMSLRVPQALARARALSESPRI